MKANSPPHIGTLILLTALATLSLNMFLPALAAIASELDADYAAVSLAVSGYLAVTAVIQLIVGPVSDRIGRRPVLLAALALFAAASFGCAVAQNVTTFLIFRMLQGGVISGYALSLAIVRDTAPERKAAALIGYVSMAMAIVPMLGPMLGGMLATAFGWRANFYAYAAAGIVLLVLSLFDLGETRPWASDGAARAAASPLLLLQEPRFWAYSLCSAFSTGAFYIFLAGAPLVAQESFGVGPARLGIYIGSITGGFTIGAFLAGRYATRFAPLTLMMAGRIAACGGLSLGLVLVALGQLSPFLYFGSTIFVGLGNGLTMPSCNARALSIRSDLAGSAAGIRGAMTVGGGAVLTALTGGILTDADGPGMLLALMLAASGMGLLSILLAQRMEQSREAGV